MLSFHYLIFFGNVFLVLVTLIEAVPLGSTCKNTDECHSRITMICKDETCRCDTPWYTPCGTECIPKKEFVYEGQECRHDLNCFQNATCDNDKRCRCAFGFTAIHGQCYRSLNATCQRDDECWSRACIRGVCQCPRGYIPVEDNNRCQKKLARIYADWTDASTSNDFCYESEPGSSSCLALNAICRNDSSHSDTFCQCPTWTTANYELQECQPKLYNAPLSPTTVSLPMEPCGRCKDENAVCANAGSQTTCWCRSGFTNENDKCVNRRLNFIFPNEDDIRLHAYTLPNCPTAGEIGATYQDSGLCVCKPGYTFVAATSTCRRIISSWQNSNFEYGVCTLIDSEEKAISEEGICHSPLNCKAQQNKHICTCGSVRYLDEQKDICYYLLDTNLNSPDAKDCPPFSNLVGIQCKCQDTGPYKTSNDKRRCELLLSDAPVDEHCANSNTFDTYCHQKYGGNSKLCALGECRCTENAYYDTDKCVTYLFADPQTNVICPENAKKEDNQCKCNDGYRPADRNRTCERKAAPLYDLTMDKPEIGSITDLTTADCKVLFMNSPVQAQNNSCVCEEGSFSNGSLCISYVMYNVVPAPGTTIYCPNFAASDGKQCECRLGYAASNNNRSCERLTNIVLEYSNTNGVNIHGITSAGCRILFGYAAEATNDNGYCRCSDPSVAFLSNNRCYFLVETSQSWPLSQEDCPPTSLADNKWCKCPPGYKPNFSNQGCEPKAVKSENIQSIDPKSVLVSCEPTYSDADCEGLHGVGAICRNNTCFCDQHRSLVYDNKCELYSKFVFPGFHEQYLYTCNSQSDCGTDLDARGIECGFIDKKHINYRVCKCRKGYFLNPKDSTCVKSQCYPQCPVNRECREYKCVCKPEHYENPSGECVPIQAPLTLYGQCNTTIWGNTISLSSGLQCSPSCAYAECASGYYEDGTKCVQYTLGDYCGYTPNICGLVSSNAECNINENKCVCSQNYYQTDGTNTCALGVGGKCFDDVECGDVGQCISRRCRCRAGKREERTSDSTGRKITRCINGINPLQFSSMLLYVILCVHFLLK